MLTSRSQKKEGRKTINLGEKEAVPGAKEKKPVAMRKKSPFGEKGGAFFRTRRRLGGRRGLREIVQWLHCDNTHM